MILCQKFKCIFLFIVGMVKQPTNESNEFQIHSEDFPALPGSQSMYDFFKINNSIYYLWFLVFKKLLNY